MQDNGIGVIDPQSDPRWDAFVAAHPSGWIYHLSGWKRALEASFPHMKGVALVKTDGPGGPVRAGLPLYLVTSILTGARLVSVPFGTLSTPLIDDDADWTPFLEAARALARNLGCSRVTIGSLRPLPSSYAGPFAEASPYRHHAISLKRDPAALLKTFDRTCVRQRISRGQASGLSVRAGETEDDFRSFFRLFMKTRKRVNRPTQPYRFLRAVWREFGPSGQCLLLLAAKDRTDLAGLLLLRYKDRVSAEWAASDDTYKNLSPNQFVFWEAIRRSIAAGYDLFDFGRTAKSNLGLMDFKNRWGTTVSDMYEIACPAPSGGAADDDEDSFLKRMIAKACGRAPDALQETLGNIIYRHLG
jgi:CelD/BcsL family acetyltransferase involved in cellulose biosynthesis